MTIDLMLATNNENGNHVGRASLIQIDDWIYLEAPGAYEANGGIICRRVGDRQIKIGRRLFPIEGYGTWVGNIMWDFARVSEQTAADVLNYIRSLGRWTCTEASIGLWHKWAHGPEFTAGDFIEEEIEL